MALFGDFGRFFQAAVSPITVPTKALVDVARGKSITEVKQTVNRELAPYQALARAGLGIIGIRGNTNTIDNPPGAPGPQQMEQQFAPQQYFQPVQFSGGSYDPNLGGGYPTWDSSTGSPNQGPTPYWGEDWAADW